MTATWIRSWRASVLTTAANTPCIPRTVCVGTRPSGANGRRRSARFPTSAWSRCGCSRTRTPPGWNGDGGGPSWMAPQCRGRVWPSSGWLTARSCGAGRTWNSSMSPRRTHGRGASASEDVLVTQSERQGAGVADEEIGRTLADIWRKVLDIDHVDPDADFFDLGGDSLLAMRVVARIRQVFG